ncbi:hypothetical protein TNCV_988341 [Trichonephila clavipes]|nr:hypothetical protein TNCV_988341 [Trichonephila clavipes]
MATVDFLHHKNPSTWAGIEPATLGAEGQRQTNHDTQQYETIYDDKFNTKIKDATPPFYRSSCCVSFFSLIEAINLMAPLYEYTATAFGQGISSVVPTLFVRLTNIIIAGLCAVA